jgi:hypothetical protein
MNSFHRSKSSNSILNKSNLNPSKKVKREEKINTIFMNSWIDHDLLKFSKNNNNIGSSKTNNYAYKDSRIHKMANSG